MKSLSFIQPWRIDSATGSWRNIYPLGEFAYIMAGFDDGVSGFRSKIPDGVVSFTDLQRSLEAPPTPFTESSSQLAWRVSVRGCYAPTDGQTKGVSAAISTGQILFSAEERQQALRALGFHRRGWVPLDPAWLRPGESLPSGQLAQIERTLLQPHRYVVSRGKLTPRIFMMRTLPSGRVQLYAEGTAHVHELTARGTLVESWQQWRGTRSVHSAIWSPATLLSLARTYYESDEDEAVERLLNVVARACTDMRVSMDNESLIARVIVRRPSPVATRLQLTCILHEGDETTPIELPTDELMLQLAVLSCSRGEVASLTLPTPSHGPLHLDGAMTRKLYNLLTGQTW